MVKRARQEREGLPRTTGLDRLLDKLEYIFCLFRYMIVCVFL